MKKFIALLAALMLVFTSAGCAKKEATSDATATESAKTAENSDVAYITEKGTLVIGMTDYAPMNYKEKGSTEWTGFDTEFAQAVGAKMGVNVEFIEIDWDNKFFELNSKSIDCIWNGMTITDEVKLNADVSKAYVDNKQVVVMTADKVAEYADAESLKGLKFAAEKGSAGEAAAKDNGLDCVGVSAQTDALLEVKAGSVDACVIDGTMAVAMTGEGTDYSELAGGIALTSEQYGIAFRKSSDMVEKINTCIDELKADGTLQKLADKYELLLAE